MKYIYLLLILILVSCNSMEETPFSEIQNKEKVKLVLSEYGLEEVPPQIKDLKNLKELIVTQDTRRWVVLPPLSWYESIEKFPPPYRELPNEILTLKNLKQLSVAGLDLHTLPDNLQELTNLETLNISFNKLDISAELDKLKSLLNLKKLYVIGNKIDSTALKVWMEERKDLEVVYNY